MASLCEAKTGVRAYAVESPADSTLFAGKPRNLCRDGGKKVLALVERCLETGGLNWIGVLLTFFVNVVFGSVKSRFSHVEYIFWVRF